MREHRDTTTNARRTHRRPRLGVALVMGLAASVLVACGSSAKTAGRSSTSASGGPTTTAGAATTTVAPTKTIVQLATAQGSLSMFLKLLTTAGLTDSVDGAGPYSVLAPTDAAFAKLDPASLDKLTKNVDLLKDVLKYHIVLKRISTKDVTAGKITTLEGSVLTLKAGGRFPTVNGLTISKGGRATNGSIFVIDTVLVPPDKTLP